MISRLDPAIDKFLIDMVGINQRLERAQREVSSGKRLNQVSDIPDQISQMLQLRTEIQQTEQVRSNLGRVQTEVDAAEQSLQAAVKVLERASMIGTQGVNFTQEPDHRQMIAHEVEALLEQMVGLSRTTVEARYIFSGNADGQPPYTLDVSLDDPMSAYLGSAATRQVMHPTGSRFSISTTAEDIFDNADPTLNVFEAINNLRLALRDDDETAMIGALKQIKTAEVHLNIQLAFYGTTQNQVAEAVDFAHKQELRLKSRLSEIEDADMVQSIVALNQARYQQEVALVAHAKIPKISLFDFLG